MTKVRERTWMSTFLCSFLYLPLLETILSIGLCGGIMRDHSIAYCLVSHTKSIEMASIAIWDGSVAQILMGQPNP